MLCANILFQRECICAKHFKVQLGFIGDNFGELKNLARLLMVMTSVVVAVFVVFMQASVASFSQFNFSEFQLFLKKLSTSEDLGRLM